MCYAIEQFGMWQPGGGVGGAAGMLGGAEGRHPELGRLLGALARATEGERGGGGGGCG